MNMAVIELYLYTFFYQLLCELVHDAENILHFITILIKSLQKRKKIVSLPADLHALDGMKDLGVPTETVSPL